MAFGKNHNTVFYSWQLPKITVFTASMIWNFLFSRVIILLVRIIFALLMYIYKLANQKQQPIFAVLLYY